MSHDWTMGAARYGARARSRALGRIGRGLALCALALPTSAPAAWAATIVVTPAAITVKAGQAKQYTAMLFDGGTQQNVTNAAQWSTGNGAVAIVSNTAGSVGLVTAIGAGQTRVTAKLVVGGVTVTGQTDLFVTGAAVVSITTKPTTKTLEVGRDTQFRATALFDNGLDDEVTKLVTWSSSNPAVATVDSGGATPGLVHPKAVGETTITATLPGSPIANTDGKTTVKSAITSIAIDPADVTLARKLKLPLRCYGKRADNSRTNISTDVQWSSSNPAVATVVATGADAGLVTAVGNGTAFINAVDPKRNLSTAASGGNATVVVSGRLVEIHVTPDPLTLAVGPDNARKAKVIGTLNTGGQTSDLARAVDWFVLDDSVADVGSGSDNGGEVTGLKSGMTTLRATEPIYSLQSPESDNLVVLGAILSIDLDAGDGLVGIGETVEYKARANYENNVTSNISDKCTWTSSRPRVATVNDVAPHKGEVTGVKNGMATITADCDGDVHSATVEVIGHQTGLRVDPATYTDEATADKKFHAVAVYDTARERDVTSACQWSSNAPSIVAMDSKEEGLAHLLAQGTAKITAKLTGTAFTADATVTVDTGVVSLEVVPSGKTIRGSTTIQMRAQGMRANPATPQDAIKVVTKQATWSSSDERIARVSNRDADKGLVTGGGMRGTATITATLGGNLTASAQVTIDELLSSFELTPATQTFAKFTAKAVGAIGHFTDGSTKRITRSVVYKTSNPNVVIVSNEPKSQGVITGVSPGTATISALDPSTGLQSSNTVAVTITP